MSFCDSFPRNIVTNMEIGVFEQFQHKINVNPPSPLVYTLKKNHLSETDKSLRAHTYIDFGAFLSNNFLWKKFILLSII